MDEENGFPYTTAIAGLIIVFAAVIIAMGFYYKRFGAQSRPTYDPRTDRLAAAIKTHPDPQVSDDLLSPERGIRLVVTDLEYADGQFSVIDGHPTLMIRTGALEKTVTAEGIQMLWGILSHEHEHYRQWVEGESYAYMSAPHPLSETACTLAVTMEIGAYAKSCRDARKYGWDSVLYQCDHVSIAFNADEKIRHDLAREPECENVWRSLVEDHGAPPIIPVPTATLRPPAPSPPKPPRPRGATYLAPP